MEDDKLDMLLIKYATTLSNIVEEVKAVQSSKLDAFISEYRNYLLTSLVYLVQNLGTETPSDAEFAMLTIAAYFYFRGKNSK